MPKRKTIAPTNDCDTDSDDCLCPSDFELWPASDTPVEEFEGDEDQEWPVDTVLRDEVDLAGVRRYVHRILNVVFTDCFVRFEVVIDCHDHSCSFHLPVSRFAGRIGSARMERTRHGSA